MNCIIYFTRLYVTSNVNGLSIVTQQISGSRGVISLPRKWTAIISVMRMVLRTNISASHFALPACILHISWYQRVLPMCLFVLRCTAVPLQSWHFSCTSAVLIRSRCVLHQLGIMCFPNIEYSSRVGKRKVRYPSQTKFSGQFSGSYWGCERRYAVET